MLNKDELDEIREKAKGAGLESEFELLIRDAIERQKKLDSLFESSGRYLDALQKIGASFNISGPLTDDQVSKLPVQVKSLRDRIAIGTQYVKSWVDGFCQGAGIAVPEGVITGEDAVKFLASIIKSSMAADELKKGD